MIGNKNPGTSLDGHDDDDDDEFRFNDASTLEGHLFQNVIFI